MVPLIVDSVLCFNCVLLVLQTFKSYGANFVCNSLLRNDRFQMESEIDPWQLNYTACFGTVLTRLRHL